MENPSAEQRSTKPLRTGTAKPSAVTSGTDGEASRRAKLTRLRNASERAEDRANNLKGRSELKILMIGVSSPTHTYI